MASVQLGISLTFVRNVHTNVARCKSASDLRFIFTRLKRKEKAPFFPWLKCMICFYRLQYDNLTENQYFKSWEEGEKIQIGTRTNVQHNKYHLGTTWDFHFRIFEKQTFFHG